MTGPDPQCTAMALIGTGGRVQVKRCIRYAGHHERRHVWLESYARADGRPVVVTWEVQEEAHPLVAEVLLPDGPIPDG